MRKSVGLFVAVSFVLVLAFAGDGLAAKPDPTLQCQAKKVNAATIFVKKLFYGEASELKNPDGFDLDAFVEGAETQFEERWTAAEDSHNCDFPFNQDIQLSDDTVNFSNVDDLMGWIEDRVSDIADLVLDGVDDTDNDSVNLGAELLRAAGQKAFSLLKAEAQNLQKPNDAKRNRARERAMNKFGYTYEKRVQKAEGKEVDVSYFTNETDDPPDGIPDMLEEIENAVDSLVDDILTVFTAQPSAT